MPSRSSWNACGRERSASATSSATSSTGTASSSSWPSAGATRWRPCLRTARLVYNADDPQLAAVGEAHAGSVAFGLDDPRVARPSLQHAADSKYCVRCGTPYDYAAAYVGHLGDYRCPRGDHARPPLEVAARDVSLQGLERAAFRLDTPEGSCRIELGLPGLYNVYNAVAAAALARTLGAELDEIAAGLERFSAAFGRFERIAVGGKRILLLLIKNPAGANEAVRTLVDGGAPRLRRRRAQRRDRGRTRRLVDLGRRLRAAAAGARDARRERGPRSRARAPFPLRRARRGRDRARA